MSSKPPDQRRHTRVAVSPAMAEKLGELSAQVTWPNLEVSQVLDMSYRGVQVRRPGLFDCALGVSVEVSVNLGLDLSFKAEGRVAWLGADVVGLELSRIPPEGHLAMREYLDARLLGQALKPVQTALFAAGATFDHWWQAAGGCNVFVWMPDSARIERVQVDMDEESVDFARGKKLQRVSDRERKALLILSQMDKPSMPMEEFLRTIAPGV